MSHLLFFLTLALFVAVAAGCGEPEIRDPEPASGPTPGSPESALPEMRVPHTDDFEVTGDGSAAAWAAAEWQDLVRLPGGTHDYTTRVKMLYSSTGLYVLLDGTDRRLTASLEGDYLHLWTEDVYEAFFWTDEDHALYFEYEISPLGYELPLLVPNFGGEFLGWIPWDYEGDRRTRKAVAIKGGEAVSGAEIEGWSAEVFIPYALLNPLRNVPPQSGSRWRANFYRNDYDDGSESAWAWSPTGGNYHVYEMYGHLVFE